MQQQILTMLNMQDAMNTRVNEQWREKNFEWYRAIWVETAELMDHYGWKWWKKQTPDVEQVHLELVDIWHFGLSILLQQSNDLPSIAQTIEQSFKPSSDLPDFKILLEQFVASTLSSKSFDVAGFQRLMHSSQLSFDMLYTKYIGKNVLNFFRQDNGYKTGEYIKIWADGKEDNEHLAELAMSLDPTCHDYKDRLYQGLEARYPKGHFG